MWTTLKTLVFTILVPGTVGVVIPFLLIFSPLEVWHFCWRPFQIIGVLAVLLGVVVYSWCAWRFTVAGKGTPAPIDPPKHLVVTGPYRCVRNPMYLAVTTTIIGEALFLGSGTLLVYAALCFIGFNLFVMLYEEPVLARKFGTEYDQYCRVVPRWIPRVTAVRPLERG
jgi:protein-S-isoprenylcysteine O-methyltransferase Ste14